MKTCHNPPPAYKTILITIDKFQNTVTYQTTAGTYYISLGPDDAYDLQNSIVQGRVQVKVPNMISPGTSAYDDCFRKIPGR